MNDTPTTTNLIEETPTYRPFKFRDIVFAVLFFLWSQVHAIGLSAIPVAATNSRIVIILILIAGDAFLFWKTFTIRKRAVTTGEDTSQPISVKNILKILGITILMIMVTAFISSLLGIEGTENPDYISQYGERHFFRKIDTEFDINAVDPVFTAPDGTEWSVEKHFEQLFGTGSEADIKTTAVWWFYNFAVRGISGGRINIWNDGTNNAAGGGGKSTTIDLIGRVIGERNILYRDLPDLTGRFAKADMVGKMLIVGYDCNADAISDTAFFKKLPFGEAISIEAKFGAVQSYRYKGAIVQAMQGFIKPKNPDGAFYRRLLTIPFFARFTGSKDKEEKNYIQDDYIKREEVRKYVLKKAVIMGNRETYPKNIVNALEQYTKEARSGSSPIYQFLDEFAKSMQIL